MYRWLASFRSWRTVRRARFIPGGLAALALMAAIPALLACGGPSAAATPQAITVRTSTPAPSAPPSVTATPTPTATPRAVAPPRPPETGRWIEVDVTKYVVRLMDGKTVVKEIGPVAVGREIDTGVYESTQTGLFHVYNKIAPLTYDAPYKTYIQWWVGFDPEKANGFHSFLLDAEGKLVDGATGRISNGCIRTGDAEAVFQFAEVGMPVFVRA
ncbi:MAG: L,D-transpeptidase [Dehalococcoidia bacterium]